MTPGAGLVPVHVGTKGPAYWDEYEERRRELDAEGTDHRLTGIRPPLAEHSIDWVTHGIDPRWVGDDTADCVAALDPCIYAQQGADEYRAFIASVARREEIALVIDMIGSLEPPAPRSILATADAGVSVGDTYTGVAGSRVGARPSVHLADDLDAAERDLGLRLINRGQDPPWWALTLSGSEVHGGAYGVAYHPPEGELRPIVVTSGADVVTGVWISPEADQRHFIVPAGTRWSLVLDWLVRQALPLYVPNALPRFRSVFFRDPALLTTAERAAEQALDDLETSYVAQRDALTREFDEARALADPVRHDLLFGSGTPLVKAVITVLTAAGIETEDLDEALGTRSADVLCALDGRHRLVEVKGDSGDAPESHVAALQRHLDTWPQLRQEALEGGVLVVNHEHRKLPTERRRDPYRRTEFVASLRHPVVTAWSLFDAWRNEDWEEVRGLVFPT